MRLLRQTGHTGRDSPKGVGMHQAQCSDGHLAYLPLCSKQRYYAIQQVPGSPQLDEAATTIRNRAEGGWGGGGGGGAEDSRIVQIQYKYHKCMFLCGEHK